MYFFIFASCKPLNYIMSIILVSSILSKTKGCALISSHFASPPKQMICRKIFYFLFAIRALTKIFVIKT